MRKSVKKFPTHPLRAGRGKLSTQAEGLSHFFWATSTDFSTTSSYTAACTYIRLPAAQHCPWLKNSAECALATAAATLTPLSMMMGDLPPSSRVHGRRLAAAMPPTSRPISVLPVNATCKQSAAGGDVGGAE